MNEPPAESDVIRWPLIRARLALWWESFWPAVMPAGALLLAILALALSGLLPLLPPWAHAGLLVLLGGAWIGLLVRGILQIRRPVRAQALRRIEIASGLTHRPLSSLEDRIATGDGAGKALWAAYQIRLRGQIARLRVGWPQTRIAESDPFALRALALLLCVAGFLSAGDIAEGRLRSAFWPHFAPVSDTAIQLDLWLTPPTYTGLPPIFASSLPDGQALHVPVGSVLSAQVAGAREAPILQINITANASVFPEFTGSGANIWRAEWTLQQGVAVTVRTGDQAIARWPITLIADQPPSIQFRTPPQAALRGGVRLDWEARDDYGLDKVTAQIARSDAANVGEAIHLTLATPGGSRKAMTGQSQHDLTAHPWAGLEVEIILSARDQAGQETRTPPHKLTLPERRFSHPVARAIIAQRKRLAAEPVGAVSSVRQHLGEIAGRTGSYGDDSVVFLGLITARSRLGYDRVGAAVEPVLSLLWDLAIRVEEGETRLRERDLKQVQEELRDAIARGADQAEIDRLMQELERAMDRYLQALTQQAMREGRKLPRQDRNGELRMIEQRDLQRMMDQARDAMRRGDRERAQQLLSELQDIMSSLQAGVSEEEDGQSDDNDASRQALDDLQGLARRQRDLMDRGMRQAGQPPQPGQGQGQGQGRQGNRPPPGNGTQPGGNNGAAGSGAEMSGQQESLRRDLGDLMRRLGESNGQIPDPLGRAERAMREAQETLQRGNLGEALGAQGEALEQIRQAARGLAEQMRQTGQGETGQGGPPQRRSDGKVQPQERDPLGRALPGGDGSEHGETALPGGSDVQRARAIFEELRRRAADPARPSLERDYLDRLLKQF